MRTLLLLTVLALLPTRRGASQGVILPDDPLEGRILFENRGCISCHALDGYGGTSGPDLVRDRYYGSFLGLVSDLWNHIPEMNRLFRRHRMPRPSFTEKEMLDLAGFIYYLRYLGERGSVARGRRLLTEKHCTLCHGEGGQAPDLGGLPEADSPVRMVQAMWNHGPEMQEAMRERGMRFPRLTGTDISDLAAYLQMLEPGRPIVGAAPGNPVRGRTLFDARECSHCHASRNSHDSGAGPALRSMALNRSVVDIAALMWNHGPRMAAFMAESDMEWPRFEGSDMADVIAYLYFLGFTDEEGDSVKGEDVFHAKGCAGCHASGNTGEGPDLTAIPHLDRPGRLAQLMWNHAGRMEDLLLTRNEPWPRLTDSELRNLLAFLAQATQSK